MDVPISAILLVLFATSAVSHLTIFLINRRRGHKFILSEMMFGFSIQRVTTMALRIGLACHPQQRGLAVAAAIFVFVGVVVVYVVNLLFAQRLVRAAHPRLGWHAAWSRGFAVLVGCVFVVLVTVIATTVQSYYTLDARIHRIDRDVLLVGQSYLLLVAFLPLPLSLLTLGIPRLPKQDIETFGAGRWRTKIAILLLSSALLCTSAGFRATVNYKTPRSRDDPAWYHGKAYFYGFNFVPELIVTYLYLGLRVDQRFHVPNGSSGPGDYEGKHSLQQLVEADPHEMVRVGGIRIPDAILRRV